MKKNSTLSTLFLILMLIIGLSLLLYPSFSEWWNARYQHRAINTYTEDISKIDNETYKVMLESARAYNASLQQRENGFVLNEEQKAAYNNELNINNSGVMGYIEIPCIDVKLSIYHTTEEPILQVAIGHLEWTSLPTGGAGTHCVVSGHRGLPSAKLFTDLDQMQIGDTFMIHVLDETLTYEVDQILIVEPDETDALLIEEGKDLFTLVTCTPYGINTHRLLVRGHRVENAEEAVVVRVTADALEVEPMIVACFLCVPILLILLTGLLMIDKIKKNQKT